MFPWMIYPQQNQSSTFEREYARFMKKMMKKHFGEEGKDKDKKKPSKWDGVTKLEVAFLLFALSPLWVPAYIALVRFSIELTKTMLQGL